MADHRLTPEVLTPAPCPVVATGDALDMLHDESRLAVPPETVRAVYRPSTPGQLVQALRDIAARGERAVLSGGRTGIAGGAVPVGAEAVVTLAAMRRLLAVGRDAQGPYVRVQPGVTLAELDRALSRRPFDPAVFDGTDSLLAPTDPDGVRAESDFARALADGAVPPCGCPINPTEMTAHVGGAVATNASGARTFRYGPMRAWVRAIAVVLADGRLLRLRRGEVIARDGRFALADPDGGADRILELPVVPRPACKQSLGYASDPALDAVDLFVGQEGTLGAVVEIELALMWAPVATLGVTCVVPGEDAALSLCELARGYFGTGAGTTGRRPSPDTGTRDGVALAAVEYFSPEALAMLRAARADDPARASTIPALPREDGAAVYLEFTVERDDDGNGPSAGEAEDRLMASMETLTAWLADVGGDPDATWAAFDTDERARQKAFRHAVPELVNAEIARRARTMPGLHKVGTDMAVPDAALREAMAMYRRDLASSGMEAVLFGHWGDNHVHVNLLPRSLDELAQAKAMYADWARRVVAMGGAVAAEHGIGRLKKALYRVQCGESILSGWRALRSVLDPAGRLGPGVLLDDE